MSLLFCFASSSSNSGNDNEDDRLTVDNIAVTTNEDTANAVRCSAATATAETRVAAGVPGGSKTDVNMEVQMYGTIDEDDGERFTSCSSSSGDDERGGAGSDSPVPAEATRDNDDDGDKNRKKPRKNDSGGGSVADATTSPPPDVIMHHNCNDVKRKGSRRGRRRRRSSTGTPRANEVGNERTTPEDPQGTPARQESVAAGCSVDVTSPDRVDVADGENTDGNTADAVDECDGDRPTKELQTDQVTTDDAECILCSAAARSG